MSYILRPELGIKDSHNALKKLTEKINIAFVNQEIVINAIESGWRDLEDAIQYHTAIHNHCEAVVSRNTKDFKPNRIPALSPGEFIASYL